MCTSVDFLNAKATAHKGAWASNSQFYCFSDQTRDDKDGSFKTDDLFVLICFFV